MAELPLVREEKGLVRGAVYAQEAMYYKRLPDRYVQCVLCYHQCKISPGEVGFCRARTNKDGTLYTFAFSNPCAVHVESIEKEPFYHFLPGTINLSIAIAGCNLRCNFCQNWLITQFSPIESMNYFRSPKDILELATINSCPTINFTYSEPTIFYEYMFEIAKLAKSSGIKNICHTNGLMNEEPLRNLCKILDAICVDLKGFEENFYQDICSGSLEPVLKNLKIIREEGVHLEIVTLVIPEINDNLAVIERMCHWIIENLGPDVPLHFLKFHPRYKLSNLNSTHLEILERAREVASSCGLHYSYISNIPAHPAKATYCPECKNILIERESNEIISNEIKDERCRYCNFKIAGLWK
jgi:pyruvate formate lyase activating enzyme